MYVMYTLEVTCIFFHQIIIVVLNQYLHILTTITLLTLVYIVLIFNFPKPGSLNGLGTHLVRP